MKSVMLGAQAIQLGIHDVVVAGGAESMSNIPYLLPTQHWSTKYGERPLLDSLEYDGLRDAYAQIPMGNFADKTGEKYNISRED